MELSDSKRLAGETNYRTTFRSFLLEMCHLFDKGSPLDRLQEQEEVPTKDVKREFTILAGIIDASPTLENHRETARAFEELIAKEMEIDRTEAMAQRLVAQAVKIGMKQSTFRRMVDHALDKRLDEFPVEDVASPLPHRTISMSRLIAKVPANWKHPILTVRGKRRLAEFSPHPYATVVADWDALNAAWEAGTHPDIVEEHVDPGSMSFEQWHGERPVPDDYAPWSAEEATWVQLWNDIGPGHPVTPPFATIQELHEHLVTSGETYLHDVGLGPGPSTPYQRHDAGFYVQQFEKSQADRNTNDHVSSP